MYASFEGRLSFGEDQYTFFRAAHMSHKDRDPHVWLSFRTGSWFHDEPRDCWVAAHIWTSEGKEITRVTDAKASPFWRGGSEEFRLLTREEVIAQPGGMDWVIARRLQFVQNHPSTQAFLSDTAA
jgi:hypothetical protein